MRLLPPRHPAARLLLATLATSLGITGVGVATMPAVAAPDTQLGTALAPAADVAASGGTVTAGSVQVADATSSAALTRLNQLRAQFGVAAVGENASWSAGAQAHSTYMASLNEVSNVEDPGQPLYSTAGDTAARNSHVAIGYTSPAAFVDAWAASPFHLITMLSPKLTTSGYGQATVNGITAGTLNVLQGRTASEPTTGWPRVWPQGTTSILELSDGAYPDPVAGCSAPAGSWYGTASIIDFGPSASITSATAKLIEDGASMQVCVRTAQNYSNPTAKALMAGKVLVIPNRPLVKNRSYSGTITTNAGSTSWRFDTGNPASGVTGDHNGDGRADVLAVRRDTGQLLFYQSRPGPALASSVVVGNGWQGFDWMAVVPDLNGDGRTELLGREASTGRLYLYKGLGQGRWATRVLIGHGFGGYGLMTVINDITGDNLPELLARRPDGMLMRFSFTAGGAYLTNTLRIGNGWNVVSATFSVNDFNGDGAPELIARWTDGRLFSYRFRNGLFNGSAVVGNGWKAGDRLWSPGDIDGDGISDLLAVRNGGELYFYKNNLRSWNPALKIGWGWDVMSLLT
ncbi:FG-GAP-like repeat-containing protein [Aestuariimicrobium soli]|uniref:FG-GAP-like repeat-containing protein n=1 Tax=Aestuariimicrobium soli TaxID=2035834 RepID=UPI003EBFA0D2